MATVLLTWELGGGMGHLARLRPIALALKRLDHRVVGAFRELGNATTVFADAPIQYVQAPSKRREGGRAGRSPETFAQLLEQSAFGDERELRALVSAWRTLFDLVQPDLLISDHSPTALLAARGCSFKRAVVGTGFICPPPGPPLPVFRAGTTPEQLAAHEQKLLNLVNDVLKDLHAPRLAFLGQLYADVDELALTTFAELDQFGPRGDAHYWGAWPAGVGETGAIDWPPGEGPRLYGYLKPFKALDALLERLSSLRLPTVIVVDGIDVETQERFASQTMRFLQRPIEAARAATWCDFAILNATHGMLSAMLLAGKPTLNVPIQLEQRLSAMKVVDLRAGVAASATEPEQVVKALDYLLENRERLATAAGQFATRYRDFNPVAQVQKLTERLHMLM